MSGLILRVDLTRKKIFKEPLADDLAANFIGGRGINVKILYDEVGPETDPLAPSNKLIFGTGPLTGTAFAGSRFNVSCKSPLTGILGDGNSGGHWGTELKYAGYDHIVIQGASKEPVYLWINDDEVELRDAGPMWGYNTWETDEIIKDELGDPEVRVASIGQAGENLVKYACLINDLSRAPGRTGNGAVMGSKKLKAIAVRGTKGVNVADPEAVEKLIEKWYWWTAETAEEKGWWYPKYGTPILMDLQNATGVLPVGFFETGSLSSPEELEQLSGYTFIRDYAVKSKGCFGCSSRCSHYFKIREGPFAGTAAEGVEFEAINGFGARCRNTNLPSILFANTLVNQYGLDIVSTANSISLAMYLYERGIITKKETQGLNIGWGDHEVIIELIHKIAKREGFGSILAEGCLNAAKIIGKGAEKYVVHSKGLTPTSVELRPVKGTALSFATSTRGADHLRGILNVEMKAKTISHDRFSRIAGPEVFDAKLYGECKAKGVIWQQHASALVDSLEICKFQTFFIYPADGVAWPEDLADILKAVTGKTMDADMLMTCAERILNVERCFNAREGITRKDDTLSERLFQEPLPSGPTKGEVLDKESFNRMLDDYYRLRGWDIETGIPTQEKLEYLGLKYISEELKELGHLKKGKE